MPTGELDDNNVDEVDKLIVEFCLMIEKLYQQILEEFDRNRKEANDDKRLA